MEAETVTKQKAKSSTKTDWADMAASFGIMILQTAIQGLVLGAATTFAGRALSAPRAEELTEKIVPMRKIGT